ncbi:MAG TPA: pyridoxal-dependent decarboxylase [Planctomycetota bacterium]|nr:pyridoxal-dependent decarboxylase [Planctomycetota bacterium]
MQDADEQRVGHMSPDEFRRAGRAVVDWVADYLERVESFPVRSRAAPGDVRAKLPAEPPQVGEPLAAVLRDLDEIVLPGITHWQSPNFFAYFPSNASPSAILGELVSAGLGVQGMSWQTSPACTELETHLCDWFVELLGLPGAFLSSSTGGGVIQDTASSATLCALLAARERAGGAGLVAYASDQAHSSVEKAVRIAGLGREGLRVVPSDARFALRPDALAAAIAADRAAGRRPFFLCASVGTTSSTAIDPVAELVPIAREAGLWLHVDAALAGSAAICPELRWIQAGVEHADSYCFNPHKWLLTNFDCDLFWVRERAALLEALSILPEYLRTRAGESGAVIDYRDWQIPLGRRVRALKLWFVLRHYGVAGLRAHVRKHVALAAEFARWVEADPEFELAAPSPLNLVCFRARGDDARNEALLERLNASGDLYLTHTRLAGRTVLRMAIGGTWTERRHVEAAWRAIQAAAREA